MRIKLLILSILFSFNIKLVFAGDAPVLTTPSNNTIVTSSRLEWQTPAYQLFSSSPYRIQVDDDLSFSSINKDYYTANTHYTPSLSNGVWNWRVKAKDASGTWSGWSSIWSFTLSTSTPTPSPTLTPTPSPTPIPSNSSSSSSFTISNIPSQINSDQSFNSTVTLFLSDKPNTTFYLKGAFKKAEGSNYFGLTKVGASWIKNSSNFTNQYKITTDLSGNWSGNLEVRADSEDLGFTESGNYLFKVGRYKDSDSSSVTWSNEFNIEITQAIGSDDISSTESTSPLSPNPTSNPSFSQTKSLISQASSVPKNSYQTATVAAITNLPTSSAKIEVKNQKQINPFLWGGVFLVFAGAGCLGYIYFKKNR